MSYVDADDRRIEDPLDAPDVVQDPIYPLLLEQAQDRYERSMGWGVD